MSAIEILSPQETFDFILSHLDEPHTVSKKPFILYRCFILARKMSSMYSYTTYFMEEQLVTILSHSSFDTVNDLYAFLYGLTFGKLGWHEFVFLMEYCYTEPYDDGVVKGM